jgi:transcriptional regulator GlxA family with amidase domain
VDRAVALLSADPLAPPDGAELARAAGLSPAHLTRLFTRTVGAPPRHFLLWLRVRRARELLDQGLPLAQCATEAGFADQSHLHRAFVRIMGLTPGQYAAARSAGLPPDDPDRPPDQ